MQTSINLDGFTIDIRGSTGSLVVGKPGSGKSVLLSYLMLALMSLGAFPLIADTKRSDFYSLRKFLKPAVSFFPSIKGKSVQKSVYVKNRVSATPNQVALMLRTLVNFMNKRYETHDDHWGWDWCDYHLRPVLLVFDEFAATLSEADRATAKEITGYLRQLIFKSRQMGGIYLLLASQRLTADVLDRNISSEFSTRIGMQNLDRISLNLAFPGCNLDEVPKVQNIPGHGLIYDDHFNTLIPQPFVAPDMSLVNVPQVVGQLDHEFQFNNFSHENYWPW